MASTQAAMAEGATLPALSLPSLSQLGAWFADPHWGRLPQQRGGSAAGRSHHASVADTRSGRAVGHPQGTGPGELPAYAPFGRKVTAGPSTHTAGMRGFVAATSRRDAAHSTQTSTAFDNADGSTTRKLSQTPINYRDAQGGWQAIDTTLGGASGSRWQEKANSLSVSFAGAANDGSLVRFATDSTHQVSYALQGAAKVQGQVSGSTVSYPAALPGTDLVLQSTTVGLKEAIVLHDASAANSWTFPLSLTGLTAVAGTAGAINLVDANGRTVEKIPAAYAFDSKVDPRSGDPATTHAVTYRLTGSAGHQTLVVTLDPKWLHASNRVFPVTVDPTINDGWTTTYAESNNLGDHSSELSIKAGSWDSGPHSAVGYIGTQFQTFDNSHVTVTSANLQLFDTWASICTAERFDVAPVTSGWTPSGVTGWPGPSYGGSIGNLTPSVPDACANTAANRTVGDWVTVPLSTATFQGWANGTSADDGLAVYAATNDNLHWKQFGSFNDPGFSPYLNITYTGNINPQLVSEYPANNTAATTLTPEFAAAAIDDGAPNSTLQYDFQIYNSSNTKVVDSGLVSGGDWTVPSGKLTWGQTYYWTVQAYDGSLYSYASPWAALTIAVPQPVITSGLSQNQGGHGFDPSQGNYTTNETDASVSVTGPSVSVQRDYNSLDPRWAGAFGGGWSSIFDARATEQTSGSAAVTGLVVTYPDGSQVGYGKNADDSFAAPAGRFATVAPVTGGGYTLTDKQATVYSFTQSLGSGVYGISSVTDANGRAVSFTWASGQITTMTSATSGRALHLTWSTPTGATAAHVAAVSTDPVTGTDQTTDQTWQYNYTGDQLTSVCPPTDYSHCTSYAYGSGSQYLTAALDLNPHSLWTLSEAAGATTAASSVLANEGTDNATYSGVTTGQAGGPLNGSSATVASFNGTSSYVSLPSSLANAAGSQSVSMWFKTTATAGVLYSYSQQPVTNGQVAGFYTPSIYVGTDGKINAEFWYSAGVNPIVSPHAENDGNWHHLVLSANGASQTLYIDGAAAGTVNGTVSVGASVPTFNQNYNTLGAGFLGGGWPDEPNAGKNGNTGYASYFNGSIADVGFYTQPLTAAQVSALYSDGSHPASLLNKITRPLGGTDVQVSYDSVSNTVTQMTDPNGGIWKLGKPTVAGSSQTYRGAVLGGGPAGYWRLGDPAGSTSATDEVHGGLGTYNAVTLGSAGPFSDQTAGAFNGSSSFVQVPGNMQAQTSPASVEMWFQMPSGNTAGGVLFDQMGASLTGGNPTSSNWTPVLYVGTDGKLHAKFWDTNGTGSYIVSSASVNDGKWHHALLAASANSQALYLDGVQTGSTLSAALLASNAGYSYIGAGESGGNWANHPTNTLGYFPGSIAEAAFYRTQLSAQDAASHFAAGKNSTGLLPVKTVKVTDPGNATLTYKYDVVNGNRLISETDGLGNTTSYGYDTAGFEHTTTDPNGSVTTTGHDVRGNVVSTTTCQNQPGNVCSTLYYSYYPDDTTAQLTTADGRNDVMLTQRDGRSASATDNTYLTSYGYDTAGNRTTVNTPAVPGYPNGRTTTTVYADGTSTYPAADSGNVPKGLPVRVTTPGGAVARLAYFHNGDVASTTDAGGLVTKYTYDGIGRVLTKTQVSDSYPNGLTTSYTYDKLNRQVSQTDPGVTDQITGAVHTSQSSTVYDADGQVTSQTTTDTTGGDSPRTQTYTYNALDQLATASDPNAAASLSNGSTTTYSYDVYGNKVKEVAQDGTTTQETYDADSHLLTEGTWYNGDPTNPSSTASLVITGSRAYDPAGRLASITDSMGNTTKYTYTDDGLVSTVTRYDNTGANPFVLQSDQYDAAGNLTQRTTNNGATVSQFQIDAASRVTSTTVDPTGVDRTTQVSYSPDDQAVTVNEHDSSNWDHTTVNTYDTMGRQLTSTLYGDSSGHPSAWWTMKQTSGTTVTDNTGNGFTGNATGVTWGNNAASLAGTTGEGIYTNGPVLNTAGAYSVSAWVNMASVPNYNIGVVAQSGSKNSAFAITSHWNGTKPVWSFWHETNDTTSPGFVYDDSTITPTANTWTHLAAVYNPSTGAMQLYVNGTLAATATDTAPWSAGGKLSIGSDMWLGNIADMLNGQVSNVQAYPRALSASEVTSLYNNGQTGGTVGSNNSQTSSTTYDQRGVPTSMTDPNGNTTNYTYDEAGQLATTTAPAVSVETNGGAPSLVRPVSMTGYNTFGETTEARDANLNETTYAYDADGQKISETLPNYTPPGASSPIAATSTWTYDSNGHVVAQSTPDGETTQYLYDQLNDLVQTTAADGTKSHTTYDTNGEALSVTDRDGAQTQATYDWMGRQITSTQLERYPSTQTLTSTNSYAVTSGNPYGAFLASSTTPGGVTTTYGYNRVGEKNSVTDAAGNTTTYSYDYQGKPQNTYLPDGTHEEVDYTPAGLPAYDTKYDAANNVVSSSQTHYDGLGNVTSATDANGHTSTFTYDATNMLTQEVQPVSATSSVTTSFGYDAAGQRTRFTDGRGNNWLYTYNSWNLPETTTAPAVTTSGYSYTTPADSTSTNYYNGDGQLVSQNQPGGVSLAYTYDKVGNLLTQSGSGADAATATRTFTYDNVGQLLTAATSAAGTSGTPGYQAATSESFNYNDRGQLLSATGSGGNSSFSYTSDGNLASRTDAAGTTNYGYDTAGRLSTVNDPATGTALSYAYNKLSQLSSVTYGTSGNVRNYSYDSLHRLLTDTLSNGSTNLASVSYGYDTKGNLTSKNTTGVSGASNNTYGYDWADRLSTWNNGTTTTNYGYDASGNRTQVGSNVFTYDARDQLTSDGTNTYRYSARGTMTLDTTSSSSVAYAADAFGQQITAGNQTYGLDAMGRNITDTSAADGTSRTFQYSGPGNTIASDGDYTYTYGPGGDLIGYNNAGATSTSTGQLALTDQHSDNIGAFTPGATALSASTTYDPLGNVTSTTGLTSHLGFQSGWTEASTGKVGTASRWYNPATGTFLNKDTVNLNPAPNSAEANPFAYVGDNPMLDHDPSGHCGGFFGCLASGDLGGAWNAGVHDVSSAVSWGSSAVDSGIDDIRHGASWLYHASGAAAVVDWTNRNVVQPTVHAVHDAYNYGRHLYNSAVNYGHRLYNWGRRKYHQAKAAVSHALSSAWNKAKKVGGHLLNGAKRLGGAIAHATTSGLKWAGKEIKAHAAAITGFVVGVAVFAGCEAVVGIPTAGAGAIAGAAVCGALAGEASGAASQGVSCAQKGGDQCSGQAFGVAIVAGGIGGAIGGGIAGGLGGKIAGALGDSLLGKMAGGAITGGLSGAGGGAAGGAVGYGLTCGDSCSAGGLASAAGHEALSGAESGAGLGGLFGAFAPCHSFTGSTKVLMADGSSKAIDQIKVGDLISNSVPGEKGTQAHKVTKVIVTKTDHDFVDVTIKPTGATSSTTSAAPKAQQPKSASLTLKTRLVRRAGFGLAASVTGAAALLGLHHDSSVQANASVAYSAPATVSAAGGTIETTFHHPFYDETQSSFVEAKDLRTGDVLQTPTGTAQVTGVRLFHANTVTYDLTIGDLHTYFVEAGATPVLVHNCGGADPAHATKCRCATNGPTRMAVQAGEVGSFRDLNVRARRGDGLTPDHIPQNASGRLPNAGDYAAVVLTDAEHALTRDFKAKGIRTKRVDAPLTFRQVVAAKLWNYRSIGQQLYNDPTYFNDQITAVLDFYRTNYPGLLDRPGPGQTGEWGRP